MFCRDVENMFRYLFLWKIMPEPVILLMKCVFRVGMPVFVWVCVIPPTANLPKTY